MTPWRCSMCGAIVAPDPVATILDSRYATGSCPMCHVSQVLIRANTVSEATEGYHRMLEADRKREEERAKVQGAKK